MTPGGGVLDLPDDTGVSIAVGDMLNYRLFIVHNWGGDLREAEE